MVGLGLKDQEERLVEEIESYLEAIHPEENILVRKRFIALKSLGEAISLFPSIREVQAIRGVVRDENMLLESLCEFAPSTRLLHIPTRIVATRSFLIAKCHAFSFIALLVQDRNDLYSQVREIVFSVICTLMAEEVYFSCLEDPVFSMDIKRRLANDLIVLWENGIDPRSGQHLPALEALWTARDNAPPIFGTMDGSSELVRISLDLGKDWQEFLVKYIDDDETRWALEEFLFGLSYEEIREVRSRLGRFGIMAVGHDEVRSFLGGCPAYTIVRNSDPRAAYDFYIDRRDTAAFRRRTSAPGPRKALEEMYLKFRIAQE
ncbi:MAG: hypothetical protein LBP81_10010 [Treponema sp.]|nr:hypothetical protein [Treponema sp.]